MTLIKQSDTTHPIDILLIDSADHVSGKTGATLTITASKNGAAFVATAGSVVERGSGWYAWTPAAGDVGTLGDLALHVTAAGADPTDVLRQVVAFDPFAAAGLGLTNLDLAVSTRLATAGYTAPDNATIALINAAVDTEVAAILAAVDTEVAAIKAKTDNLPAAPAAVGSAMLLTLNQAIPDGQTAGTVGDALVAAEVEGGGAWSLSLDGLTLTLKRRNGTTWRTFTLDAAPPNTSSRT